MSGVNEFHSNIVGRHMVDMVSGVSQKDLFKVDRVEDMVNGQGQKVQIAFNKSGETRLVSELKEINRKNLIAMEGDIYEQILRDGSKREKKMARRWRARDAMAGKEHVKNVSRDITKEVMKAGGVKNLTEMQMLQIETKFNVGKEHIEKVVNDYTAQRKKEIAKQKKIDEIKSRHSGKPSLPDVVKDFETKPKKSPKVNGGKPIVPPAAFKLDEFLGAFPNYNVYHRAHEIEKQQKGGSPAGGPPKPPEPPKGGERTIRGSVSGNQYRRAQKGLQKAEMNAGKEALMGVRSRISKMSGKSRVGTLAALGLKLGVTHSMLDNDDDTVMSTLITSSVYAGGITGAVFAGKKYLDGVDEAQKKEKLYRNQSERFETAASGDQKKIDELKKKYGEEKGEEIRKRKNLETKEERLKRTLTADGKGPLSHEDRVVKRGKQMMKAGKIGMGVIAVGGVLSALHGMKRSGDVEDIKDDGEKKIRLEKREQKQKNRDYGYNNPTMGNIAFEMFEQRTGHYKMGDSRFQ